MAKANQVGAVVGGVIFAALGAWLGQRLGGAPSTAGIGAAVGVVSGAFAPNMVGWIQDRNARRQRAASVAEPGYEMVRPSRLLDPTRGVVQFTGRTAEMAGLVAWCEDDGASRLRLITGPAGVGKTRLSVQLAAHLTELGWHCVRVGEGHESAAVQETREAYPGRVLLVLDYAETRIGLAELLRAVASDEGMSLRVLLLARGAGHWWEQLGAHEPAVRDLIVAAGPDGDMLERQLDPNLAQENVLRDAAQSFAAAIGVQPPSDVIVSYHSGQVSILELHAAALVAVLEEADAKRRPAAPVELSGVLDELLRHEERFWIGTASAQCLMSGPNGLTPSSLRQVIVAGSLLGAVDEQDALDILDRVPEVPRSAKVTSWLRDLYPPLTDSDGWLGAMQPDRLAELLVTEELTKSSALAEQCLTNLSDRQARRAVIMLARASADYDSARHLLGDLMPRVSEVITCIEAPIETLMAIANAIPYPSAGLAAANAVITQQIVESLPPDTDPKELALGFMRLALAHGQIGRESEATSAATRARSILREQDESFLLAVVQSNLSKYLPVADRLSATEEAVEIFRQLEESNPGSYQDALAAALANHGAQLSQDGQYSEGLAAMEKALQIRRELARVNPDRHGAELATSLNNLRIALSGLSQGDPQSLLCWS